MSARVPGEHFPARSLVGLTAANFVLAEVTGVVLPFLSTFLRSHAWRYNAIGVATSLAGLGVFVMQVPAGLIADRIRRRRELLAAASVVLGCAYGLLPVVPPRWWAIDPLLVTAGMAGAFFPPLLAALALALVGHAGLNLTTGVNQGWNHAGNIASAVLAMLLVARFTPSSVFFAVAAVSLVAAVSVFLIRPEDLHEAHVDGHARPRVDGLVHVLRDRRAVVLLSATALFHLANAPVMPLVALDITQLHGTHTQVAAVVLVAQAVMIPVALLAGRWCDTWGRRPTFLIGFFALPLRIFLYSLTRDARALVALQALDGLGAGVYGVAVIAVCADVTRESGGFNTLLGMIAAALSLGGVLGPLASGFLVQRFGFVAAFEVFSAVALLAVAVFFVGMPETGPSSEVLQHAAVPA